MMRLTLTGFCAFALLFLTCAAAHASQPRKIGNYSDWAAYEFTENGNKVCYMASQPTKHEGDYTRRGEIFALITHRPGEGSRNVFSYIAGYPYRSGSDVTVTIDSRDFTLFTQDDTAWTPDQDADNRLAESIRRGSRMVVRGTSSRGTQTTDTFSLRGSAAAHDAITNACK